MEMSMGLRLSQSIELSQKISISLTLPNIQWSLVQAFTSGQSGPPPYVEPTFETEEFEPRIRVTRTMIDGFTQLSHLERLRRIDESNKVFQFAYTRGRGDDDGRTLGYFKVPLLRNYNVKADDIRIRVKVAEYDLATAMVAAVGEMERIARAVRYLDLYKEVLAHLKRMGAKLQDTVLVSVDRGGRIPCTLLQRALDVPSMLTLKVDQGSYGDGLDENRLREFSDRGDLRGKHVLFVDSTVDSGRQYRCLTRFFDEASWRTCLGHTGWSLVGSNEYGRNVGPKHQDINWGVDPDATFEDRPELMGIDYAPGSTTRVVECPSDASREIRACLLSVPDGWIYDAEDIGEQISHQRKLWTSRQQARHSEHRVKVDEARAAHQAEVKRSRAMNQHEKKEGQLERRLTRITASKAWRTLRVKFATLPEETFSAPTSANAPGVHGNVLIIGSGQQTLPATAASYVADALIPYCSLLAGTASGNPGAVLKAALQSKRSGAPEVRLYQPEDARNRADEQFGGVPVTFVGPDKGTMRRRMVSDASAVLALGGAEGTLREALLALEMGKPLILVRGYGAVAEYILGSKSLRNKASLTACDGLSDAIGQLITMLAA